MTTRADIRKIMEAAGRGEHADAVDALVQPAILLQASALAGRPEGFRRSEDEEPDAELVEAMERAVEKLPLGASRFGGVPDLPPGTSWPERDGVPMEFIAQIRLADVAGLDPLDRLPARGSLLFFYNSQWETSDQEPDGPPCAVLFHDGDDAELVRAAPPRVEWKNEYSEVTQIAPMLHGMASLAFSSTVSVPGGVSPWIESPLDDFWQDLWAEHGSELQGGLEAYTANFLLGYADEADYTGAHANGTDDQLLLQVDSCDAAEFQFGDCNKLYFMMTKDELAARDFSNVRIYSQLG